MQPMVFRINVLTKKCKLFKCKSLMKMFYFRVLHVDIFYRYAAILADAVVSLAYGKVHHLSKATREEHARHASGPLNHISEKVYF